MAETMHKIQKTTQKTTMVMAIWAMAILIIFFLFPAFLSAQVDFDVTDISEVQNILVNKINPEFINQKAISYKEAENKNDETNYAFEKEHELYKEKLLDLAKKISRLSSEKEGLETKKSDIYTGVKSREAEVERLGKNIKAKNREIESLGVQISGAEKIGSETKNAIPFEGYFAVVVEGKQLSVAKDELIETALNRISRKAIKLLNNIAIESITKVSNNVVVKDKILMQISGRFTKDSASFKIDKFFNYKRTPILIYGTKVSVNPFEMPQDVKAKKVDFKLFEYWHLKNKTDFDRFADKIKTLYTIDDSEINRWQTRVNDVLLKIADHNKRSTDSIIKIVESYQQSVREKNERIIQINAELPNLKNLMQSAEQSLARQKEKYENISKRTDEVLSLLKEKIAERDFHIKSQVFAQAELKDRKYRDPVKETKAIVKDLLVELDKEFEQTGRSLTTTVNMGMFEGETEKKIRYEKRFVYGDIIPYYLEGGEAVVGALVILKAKFTAKAMDGYGESPSATGVTPGKATIWIIIGIIFLITCGLICILLKIYMTPKVPAVYKKAKTQSMPLADNGKHRKRDPAKAMACCEQGDMWFKKGDLEKAIYHYTKALELNPQDDAAYFSRAKARHEKGDFEKAVADYTKALELNPDRAKETYINKDSILATYKDDRK